MIPELEVKITAQGLPEELGYLIRDKKASATRKSVGERVNGAPFGYRVSPDGSPFATDGLWEESISAQILDHTKRARGGRRMPKFAAVHISLSYAPEDTELLGANDAQRWDRMKDHAREFLALAGLNDRPYMLVFHGDRPHLHVHIIAARVDDTGTIWDKRFSKRFLSGIAAQLEVAKGLRRVPHPSLHSNVPRPARRPATRGQLTAQDRDGKTPGLAVLQAAIDEAVRRARRDAFVFVEELYRLGVGIQLWVEDGVVRGLSYALWVDGKLFACKASSLGALYECARLEATFGLAKILLAHSARPDAHKYYWAKYADKIEEAVSGLLSTIDKVPQKLPSPVEVQRPVPTYMRSPRR